MIELQPLYDLSPQWRMVFWASFTAWLASEIWVFSRDARSASGARTDRGSRFLIIVLVWFGLWGAFACAYGLEQWGIAVEPQYLFPAGIAMIFIGMLLRVWSVLTLGRFFRTAVIVQDDHQLVIRGPYRVLRNPSYTGALVSLSGLCLAMGNWASLAAGVGSLLLAYAWRIRVEDQALKAKFGEPYDIYRKRTWALIPFVW